jgi:hypothetical protein
VKEGCEFKHGFVGEELFGLVESAGRKSKGQANPGRWEGLLPGSRSHHQGWQAATAAKHEKIL